MGSRMERIGRYVFRRITGFYSLNIIHVLWGNISELLSEHSELIIGGIVKAVVHVLGMN